MRESKSVSTPNVKLSLSPKICFSCLFQAFSLRIDYLSDIFYAKSFLKQKLFNVRSKVSALNIGMKFHEIHNNDSLVTEV